MKVGDLVKVGDCDTRRPGKQFSANYKCGCWFCHTGGSRIGVITAPSTYNNWYVMFEAGEWEVAAAEVEGISGDA